MPGHSHGPRRSRTRRSEGTGSLPWLHPASKTRFPAKSNVDGVEHRLPDEAVRVLHRLVLDCALRQYEEDSSSRRSASHGWRASPRPGTPAKYNKVGVIKVGPTSAKNVLVLEPGTSAGGAYFVPLAKWIVSKDPGWQVWSVERRENLLEDQSELNLFKHGKATATQLYDYYLGYLKSSSIKNHFHSIPDSTVAFAKQWGMNVAVEDLHRVIAAAKGSAARSCSAATRSADRSSPRTPLGTSAAAREPPTSRAWSTSTAAVARPRSARNRPHRSCSRSTRRASDPGSRSAASPHPLPGSTTPRDRRRRCSIRTRLRSVRPPGLLPAPSSRPCGSRTSASTDTRSTSRPRRRV